MCPYEIEQTNTKYKSLAATKIELDFLKNVLTYFHLIHRVASGTDEFFIVPALVPEAPTLPAPPLIKGSEQLPQMPVSVALELHRVRREYGPNVGVFDFMFDFEDEDYFPDDLFESLVCAVATKISNKFKEKAVRFSVNFYRHEATFGFNEHYIHATKGPLSMRVFSINCDAGNYTTAQYSLQVFQECIDPLVQKRLNYRVHLGCVHNGVYTYALNVFRECVDNPDTSLRKQVNKYFLT